MARRRQPWFSPWLILAFIASLVSYASGVTPSLRGVTNGEQAFSRTNPPVIAPHRDLDSSRPGSWLEGTAGRFGKGLLPGQDRDGTPPDEPQLWVAPAPGIRFLTAGPLASGTAALHTSRTFAPQGMQPEQGGQTGPPRDRSVI